MTNSDDSRVEEIPKPLGGVAKHTSVKLIGECIQLFFKYYSRKGTSDLSFRGDYLTGVIDANGLRHERVGFSTFWTEIVPGVRAKKKRVGDEEVTIVEVAQASCPVSLCVMRTEGYRSLSGAYQENLCEEYAVQVLSG